MAIKSIQAFANDGKLDAAQLQRMLDIALRDGQIDADKLCVLGKIVIRPKKGRLMPMCKRSSPKFVCVTA